MAKSILFSIALFTCWCCQVKKPDTRSYKGDHDIDTSRIDSDENWDAYLAAYDSGVGSTTLNMAFANAAPFKQFPFLITTGVAFTPCDSGGLPMTEQMDSLYKIQDDIQKVISSVTANKVAGTFTYRCDRLVYIYVHDTLHVRDKLVDLYENRYKKHTTYLDIKLDDIWEAYFTFLYPNEETQDYMSNQKVVDQLEEAGDNLEKPRPVDHWLYFRTEKDRDAFIESIKIDGFKIESTDLVQESEYPHQLKISNITAVDIDIISTVTLKLNKIAKEHNGDYDGWETVVVKE
jgi:uncharacterized protein (TIGR01619 family)